MNKYIKTAVIIAFASLVLGSAYFNVKTYYETQLGKSYERGYGKAVGDLYQAVKNQGRVSLTVGNQELVLVPQTKK